ncbi:hypothetical protein D3C80_1434350 [compost metagenome]
MLQSLHLLFEVADVGLGGFEVLLHTGLFFLELAQRLLELGNVLAGGVQLLLGLRTLIGEGRAEQARQG